MHCAIRRDGRRAGFTVVVAAPFSMSLHYVIPRRRTHLHSRTHSSAPCVGRYLRTFLEWRDDRGRRQCAATGGPREQDAHRERGGERRDWRRRGEVRDDCVFLIVCMCEFVDWCLPNLSDAVATCGREGFELKMGT
eukprot:6204929-Pleurochrysis_carterae.AAC.1